LYQAVVQREIMDSQASGHAVGTGEAGDWRVGSAALSLPWVRSFPCRALDNARLLFLLLFRTAFVFLAYRSCAALPLPFLVAQQSRLFLGSWSHQPSVGLGSSFHLVRLTEYDLDLM
jgi:hypothetical protein